MSGVRLKTGWFLRNLSTSSSQNPAGLAPQASLTPDEKCTTTCIKYQVPNPNPNAVCTLLLDHQLPITGQHKQVIVSYATFVRGDYGADLYLDRLALSATFESPVTWVSSPCLKQRGAHSRKYQLHPYTRALILYEWFSAWSMRQARENRRLYIVLAAYSIIVKHNKIAHWRRIPCLWWYNPWN